MAGDVGFSAEDSRVEEMAKIKRTTYDDRGESDTKKRERSRHGHSKRRPIEYLSTISRAAKESNEQLARKGLPYRFCVYESDGEIMIDIVELDAEGKIVKQVKRNITDEDFDRLIDNIASIEGLVIDKTG